MKKSVRLLAIVNKTPLLLMIWRLMITQPHDLASSVNDNPVQPQLSSYQKTRISDRNCSFAARWYQLYPFIEYSVQKDAIYCYSCRLFPSLSAPTDTAFTHNGFRNWKKIGEKLKKHSESRSHKDKVDCIQADRSNQYCC